MTAPSTDPRFRFRYGGRLFILAWEMRDGRRLLESRFWMLNAAEATGGTEA